MHTPPCRLYNIQNRLNSRVFRNPARTPTRIVSDWNMSKRCHGGTEDLKGRDLSLPAVKTLKRVPSFPVAMPNTFSDPALDVIDVVVVVVSSSLRIIRSRFSSREEDDLLCNCWIDAMRCAYTHGQ